MDNSEHKAPGRVLQYTYGGRHVSGIDSYLMDAYRAIDRRRTQFDFLFRYGNPYPQSTLAEIVEDAGSITALEVPERASPVRRQWLEATRLLRYFSRHRPSVVEINMTSTFMCISCLIFAKAAGVRRRIVHAHDALPHESFAKHQLKRAATPVLNALATDRWACSSDAAAYLFGSRVRASGKWTIVRNAIDAQRFAFDPAARAAMRADLNLRPEQLCVGIVGRFTSQKNHLRAIRIFHRLLSDRPDAVLVLVGDGELMPRARSLAAELGITEDSIRFLGLRHDVASLYSGFDVILAPSLHEGFPITALEAQASGLPLVVSPAYPSEADLSGAVQFVSLESDDSAWAAALIAADGRERLHGVQRVVRAGHDKSSVGTFLDREYETIFNQIPESARS